MGPIWSAVIGIAGLAGGAAFWLTATRQRRQQQAGMERLAFYDSLTGVANRLLFLDRSGLAIAQAKRSSGTVAIAFIDIDRFKLVNDSYGHNVGDEVLRGVATRLRDHLRGGDTVARFGGDEFTVLMPGLRNADDVSAIATKLLDVFRLPLRIGGRDIMVTASVGISLYPGDADEAEALLRHADSAMYRAKQRGGDNFQIYTREIDLHARQELELEARLRLALARNEFVLYYQPRVDVARTRVVGFEALLRWNDPDRGIVPPAEFMHAAEVSGLIVPIGQWAIQTACRQAKQWHDAGSAGLVVSVNLSPRQFHRGDLVKCIGEALRRTGLPAEYLELEIDESCVMTNAEASMIIMQQLKALGVRVLISHFGAGYSSLRHLRRFPIDGLKLDRSFMTGGTDADLPLATAALGMAKALHLKVTGEGVETQEAADFLLEQACDDFQGFLVSAPLPADDCAQFLVGGDPRYESSRSNSVRSRSAD
jgi:diguanylate cyclase (GGDEF)-like protein